MARWSNWAGDQRCEPARIVDVRTRAALSEAVGQAVAEGRKVKVSASGHSFTDIALTDGVMIGIGGMRGILDADPETGVVKVEAGANLHQLNPQLYDLGLAFENLGDIDKQTVAGAISTGTHGTGARFTNISAQLEGIELLTATGEWLELTEASDPDGFRAARVGLGALGAIGSVTVRCVPAYTIDRVDRPAPLDETLANLDELADGHDHFEFYVFPHTETALLRQSRRTHESPEPSNRVKEYLQEVLFENWVLGALSSLTKVRPSTIPGLARFGASHMGSSRKKDRSYRVFASQRRIRFTEMEYAIPRRHASDAIERVLDLAADPALKVLFPIEVRFVAADDALLSPSHERDTCYIAVHQLKGVPWEEYFRGVEAIMADYEGRPHWGKRHHLTAAELSGLYPRFDDFLRVRDRLDPGRTFANDYLDRVLGPASRAEAPAPDQAPA